MKIHLYFLLLIITGFMDLFSQPMLVKESPTIIEAGTLYEGEKIIFKIKILNKGNKDLILFDFKKSCGCLKFKFNFDHVLISPGETRDLPVLLDTKGFDGVVTKSVNFSSNDPKNENITYSVNVNIIPEVEIEPTFLLIGKKNSVDTLYIINKIDKIIELDTLISTGATIKLESFQRFIKPLDKTVITIKIEKIIPLHNAKLLLFFKGLHIDYKDIFIYEN